jgi:hypothetical protein
MIWPFNINSKRISELEEITTSLNEQVKLLKQKIFSIDDVNAKQFIDNDSLSKRNKKSIDNIASFFKDSLTKVNNESLNPEKIGNGDIRYVIDNFDVELKGGISIENENVFFTQLNVSEINQQSVSTLKFSVKPIITTKID